MFTQQKPCQDESGPKADLPKAASLPVPGLPEQDLSNTGRLKIATEACNDLLFHHPLQDFNHFCNFTIQDIVRQTIPISIGNYQVSFSSIRVEKPYYTKQFTQVPLFPQTAVTGSMTYAGNVYANIEISNSTTKQTVMYKRISIFSLPILVGSEFCHLHGKMLSDNQELPGHFIIGGVYRVLVSFLRDQNNLVVTTKTNVPKWPYQADFRSKHQDHINALTILYMSSDGYFYFSLTYITNKIPAILLIALLCPEWESLSLFPPKLVTILSQHLTAIYDEYATLEQCLTALIKDSDKAASILDSINNTSDKLSHYLECELFPHLGFITKEKAVVMLVYIIRTLYHDIENKSFSDKHSLRVKRLDGIDFHLSDLFYKTFRGYISTVTKNISNIGSNPSINDIVSIIKSNDMITKTFKSAFATGNWCMKNTNKVYKREGVSQVINKVNHLHEASHKRRITMNMSSKNPNTTLYSIRQVKPNHVGFICLSETPDGENVGVVTNLAVTATSTITIPSNIVLDWITNSKWFTRNYTEYTIINFDSDIIGTTSSPGKLVQELRQLRSDGLIHPHTSIVWIYEREEIQIHTDPGRFIRPLFVVRSANGKQTINIPSNFQQGIENGDIVFRDPAELETSVIAAEYSDLSQFGCQYMELHPSCIFGIVAAMKQMANTTPETRISYTCSMMKQAIGMPGLDVKHRVDTHTYVMDYVQKPLVVTAYQKVLSLDTLAKGCVPMVAVTSMDGFNQEDSVAINLSSVQRGMWNSVVYKTWTENESKITKPPYEKIGVVPIEVRDSDYVYDNLDENGIIIPQRQLPPSVRHKQLKEKQVLISKVLCKKDEEGNLIQRDISLVKLDQGGWVDRVVITTDSEGSKVYRVVIRIELPVNIGDKFASATAQKGTCGMLFRQEDMPFTKDGMVPDIIINPAAFPSRMTSPMLIEQVIGMKACKLGKIYDCTPFNTDLAKIIGMKDTKTEMFDGRTGKSIGMIAFGPCEYMRLTHLVVNKIKFRGLGRRDEFNQPSSDKTMTAGIRIGYMEKNLMISLGASAFKNDRFNDCSDGILVHICNVCETIRSGAICSECKQTTIERQIPFSMKYVIDIMKSGSHKIGLVAK